MNTRSKNQITAMRAAQRKRPTRIISLILSLSLISGNLTGFFSAAAELNHFCGKEAHTHTEECYRVYNTPDPTVTEETVVVEETVLETVPNETAESVEATTETVVETTAEAVVETTGEAVPEPAYTISETPVCGKEEHTHVVQCYSDPSADVETAEQWEDTLPENLSGIWSEDLLAVAKNQVGYSESKKNYIVEADGETISGYNRYGAWYASVGGGDSYAYAPWNVTFLFFDLYHAGINFTDFPYEETCPEWIAALNSYELYRAAGEYTPNPGDMVFVDTDGDGEADRVGVASKVEDNKLIAIEGDYEGAVAEVTYDLPELTVEPETTETEGTTEIDVSVSKNALLLLSDGTDEGDEAPQPTVVGYADMAQAQADAQPETSDVSMLETTLSAGDILYVDISQFADWGKADAKFRLWYQRTSESDAYSEELTKVDDYIYQIAVPNNMTSFVLVRLNPAVSVTTGATTWDTTATWNQIPADNQGVISIQAGSNMYQVTGWTTGKWVDNYWYSRTLANKILYFDRTTFAGAKISYDGVEYPLSEGTDILYYQFPSDSTATPDTDISITLSNESTYSFKWEDLEKNKVTISNSAAAVTDVYTRSGSVTVYFDATLSKLSISENEKKDSYNSSTYYSIPNNDPNDGKVYYCAKATDETLNYGSMTAGESNVYSVTLGSDGKTYTQIAFASYSITELPSSANEGKITDVEDIPQYLTNPCFYADSWDSSIYENEFRGGYWDEVGEIRDAEKGKGTDVVDIGKGTLSKDNNTLYVKTTLYDYYSDYELNGSNRDDYPLESTQANINTHRIYQSFRHFNQALSMFYYNNRNDIEHRLYWGQFQPDFYGGSKFSQISGTLNLYNFNDEWNKSFYENNSMASSSGTELSNGNNAVQGLVDSSLDANNNLMMGGLQAPFFNEAFLAGDNALKTKFAEVYHDVEFPFVKKKLEADGTVAEDTDAYVEYWYFDSADNSTDTMNKNLHLKQNEADYSYYLESTNDPIYAQTADNTTSLGYFPFNTSDQSGKATKLNYGFGQKFEIDFRLTSDGTVKDSNGDPVPIKFNFSGDDDVWVFIDGNLVLDIGGGHGIVTGSIDFSKWEDNNGNEVGGCRATVSSVKNTSGSTTSNVGKTVEANSDFYETEHTLTMFYMERGLWESNMKITFNFPDENLLVVEKHVNTDDVDDMFDDLFSGKDIFTFNIKTLATHFGTQDVNLETGENQNPVVSVSSYSLSSKTGITFSNDSKGSKNGIHWYTNIRDANGEYRDRRWGQIDLGVAQSLSGYETLDLEFYYDYSDNPGLSHIFINLLDAQGNTVTDGYISMSSCATGNVTMGSYTWIPISLDLSKMVSNVDTTSVRYIRLGYDYERNVYFSNLSFRPKLVVNKTVVGFIMPQNSIPDYGTATTTATDVNSALAVPVNALYTSTTAGQTLEEGTKYRIGSNGQFTLQDGESVTFEDQFRRGSYIYLEEEANPLYHTTWAMYEGKYDSLVTSSAFPTGYTSSTVSVNAKDMPGTDTTIVTDGRTENQFMLSGEKETDNAYQKNNWGAPNNTFVFRHYTDPDNTAVTTKLKVVYTNTINVGTLTVSKVQAGSAGLGEQEFEFYVVFHNVGGMALEGGNPIRTEPFKLKVGDTKKFTGIPVGTWFTIHEVVTNASSGEKYVLEGVNITGESTRLEMVKSSIDGKETYSINGDIPKGDNRDVSFTFKNSKKYVTKLTVNKAWETNNDANAVIPDSITVKLQRKLATEDDSKYVDVAGYTNVTLHRGYKEWSEYSYTFEDLQKYKDDDTSKPYIYRVVELGGTEGVITFTKTDADGKNIQSDYTIENGTVGGTSDEGYTQTITNKLKSNISITVTKEWKDGKGNALTANLPESITVRLQRTTDTGDSKTWEDVKVNVNGEEVDITLPQNNSWSYTYTELPAKSTDGKVYTYRVVELDSGAETPVVVETGSRITYGTNDYTVTYGNIENAKDSEDKAIDGKYTQTITNTLVPKVKLDITKLSAMDNSPLNGVTFKLEKQSGSGQTEEVGSGTTADGGKLTFTDLEPGTYQLTETKTADGYSLLKAPISIVITPNDDGSYSASVDNSNVTMTEENGHYTLATTIYNKQNLTMPATGGVNGFEFWILGGLCMMAVPLLLYTFFWFKKGGKYLQK